MSTARVHTWTSSPLGRVLLVADADGALVGCYLDGQRHLPADADACPRDDVALAPAVAQLEAYLAGERHGFDLPLRLEGTPFRRRVWQALREVPYGTTTTYGELARRVDAPTAARAVGAAVGRNPLAIVVPCHRVVGASGALTGYAGGVDRKRALLALERTAAAPTLPLPAG